MDLSDVEAVTALLREMERRLLGPRDEGLPAAALRQRAEHLALVASVRVPAATPPAVAFEPPAGARR